MPSLFQIKRSLNTAIPGSLANGEFAYTANGDVLYLGSNGAIVAIGGKRNPGVLTANQALVANSTSYLDVIKTANLYIGAVTVNTINAVANSTVLGAAGNNELTTTWAIKTYVDSKTSGLLSVGNGLTSNATHQMVLAGNSQLVSNSTGVWLDQTKVDITALSGYSANKFIDHTAVTLTAGNGLTGGGDISANRSFAVSPGATAPLVANSTGLFVVAGTGVTVNSTGVHIGQAVGTGSSVTFNDITVSGNLVINGTLTNINATNLTVTDPMIMLANGNATTDSIDIGVYGTFGNSTVTQFGGLFRDTSNSAVWTLFNTQTAPTTTVDTSAGTYAIATLLAAIKSFGLTSNTTVCNITANSTLSVALVANTLTLSSALGVASGGTGAATFTTNGILYGNGTGAIQVTAAGADGKVMVSSSGTPTWSDLDGGTF